METEKTTKTIYTVSVKFAKEENGDLRLDKTKETRYENMIDKDRALRLAKFLETQIQVPKDFPIAYFSLGSKEVNEKEYKKLPVGGGPSRPILEYTTNNEVIEKEIIHEIREGHFVRRLYLCDIIKSWDYEKF